MSSPIFKKKTLRSLGVFCLVSLLDGCAVSSQGCKRLRGQIHGLYVYEFVG